MTYKRHYGKYGEGEKTLCGLDTTGGHMLANGFEDVHRVTCKNCQKTLVACINTGDDNKWVEYEGNAARVAPRSVMIETVPPEHVIAIEAGDTEFEWGGKESYGG